MKNLVIHAPDHAVKGRGATSFEHILSTGVGPGYAISNNDIGKLTIPGSPVVLLRKDRRKARAEGRLIKIVPTGRYTRNGRQRYDVHIAGLKLVAYNPEKLNRFGYAVI